MELLLLVFLIVAVSRWAYKHDQTLLTEEEYEELWRNSPYAHYEGIFDTDTTAEAKPPQLREQ